MTITPYNYSSANNLVPLFVSKDLQLIIPGQSPTLTTINDSPPVVAFTPEASHTCAHNSPMGPLKSPDASEATETREEDRKGGPISTRKGATDSERYGIGPQDDNSTIRRDSIYSMPGKFDKPPKKGIELERYKDNKVWIGGRISTH